MKQIKLCRHIDLVLGDFINVPANTLVAKAPAHEPKDDAVRKQLHTAFAKFRNGYQGKFAFLCSSEKDVEIYKTYMWEESLALGGKRDKVRQFKRNVDAKDDQYWNKLFSAIPQLEKQEDPRKVATDPPIGCYIEEYMGIPGVDYQKWHEWMLISPEDYSEVNDLYCLCLFGTWLSRRLHWTGEHASKQELLPLLRAMKQLLFINRYKRFIRTVEEIHKLGYEKLRICPGISPNGCAWRCVLTVKENTNKDYGIYMSDFDYEAVYPSNGFIHEWDMMQLSPYDNAVRFLKEHPKFEKLAKGKDPEYAKWFKLVVRAVYNGHIPWAYDDWSHTTDHVFLTGVDMGKGLPMPPKGDGEGLIY